MPKTIIPKELKFQEILHDKNTHVLSKEELNKIFDIDRFNKLEYIEVQNEVLKKYEKQGYRHYVNAEKKQGRWENSPIELKMTLAKYEHSFFKVKENTITIDEKIFPCFIQPTVITKYQEKIPLNHIKNLVTFKNKFRVDMDHFRVLSLLSTRSNIEKLLVKRLLVYSENNVYIKVGEWNEK